MTRAKPEARDAIRWAALKKGDINALSDLYHQSYQMLYEYGMRLHPDKVLVQDSIQDLFIKLWLNRDTLSAVKRLKPYLLVALRGTVFNKLKPLRVSKTIPLKEKEHDFQMVFSAETETIKDEQALQQTRSLQHALNQLTPRQKEIIYLRYFEELEYPEIAGIMDLSVKGAYKLLSRALDSLRTVMNLPLLVLLNMLMELKGSVMAR